MSHVTTDLEETFDLVCPIHCRHEYVCNLTISVI